MFVFVCIVTWQGEQDSERHRKRKRERERADMFTDKWNTSSQASAQGYPQGDDVVPKHVRHDSHDRK